MKRKFRFDIQWVFIIAIIIFLIYFEVLPLTYLIIRSLFQNGSFTLETFKRMYSMSINWLAIKNTIIAAFTATILGMIIAFPLAWLVGRTNLYGKKFFRSAFVTTYMIPPYVGAIAWLRLLNPTVGTLNKLIMNVFNLSSAPFNIYTMGGLIWVLTSFYYPYAFITISRAMEKMDPTLEEASRISGAGPLETLKRVTLPMMTPSLVAAALLVFVSAASCYGIPSIIGVPARIHTVTTRIIDFVYIGSQEGLTDATTLAVVLMLFANIVLFLSSAIPGKKKYITMSGKSTRPNTVDLGKWRKPITIAVGLFSLVMIVIPFLSVLMTSFTVNMGKSFFDINNLTMRYWKTILTRESIISSAINSLTYATITSIIGIFISLVLAYFLERTTIPGRHIPDYLITLGSGTPSVVIALSLVMTMRGKFGLNIYNTAAIMIVAYLIKYLLMGLRTVVSAMSQVHPSLEEAAQISGAGWIKRYKDITIPLIGASVVAGIFLIFMPVFYELTMSTLLYSSSTKTIGFELYNYQTYHSQQTAAALSSAILIFVILINYILNKLTKGEFSI